MKKSKLIFLIVIILIVSSVCYVNIFANDQGSPKKKAKVIKPLHYIDCTFEDGTKLDDAQVLTTTPRFILNFDKNIVNMLVWDNNRQCITLTSSNKTNIPITVTKIDDTVDFEHRKNIFIEPDAPLISGETYVIRIDEGLMAKNAVSTIGGSTEGKPIEIMFKVN
jgi:hypothetical protein